MTTGYDIAVEKSQTKIKRAMEIINEYVGNICYGHCKDCPFHWEMLIFGDKCYRDVCIHDLFDEGMKKLIGEGAENDTGVRDCLSCSNSFSEQKDNGNVLHCMVHNEEIVEENYCCEDYN